MRLKYGFWTYFIVFGLMVPSALLRAYALLQCWTWFAVPLGAPTVSQPHVYGLSCMLSMVTYQSYRVKDEEIAMAGEAETREATGIEKVVYVAISFGQAVLPTLIGWGLAAAAHFFMLP